MRRIAVVTMLLLAGGALQATERAAPEADPCAPQTVYFDYDQSQLNARSREPLDAVVTCFQAKKGATVEVGCHTDARGTSTYNLAVGERYVKSVTRYLVAQGVPRTAIEGVSFGEERPVCKEPTEACHARNRRCELTVVPKE